MSPSPSTANKVMDQHTWVQKCLDYYKENNLTPEPGGEWQEAHYPAPKGLGKDVIWLRFEDHQVQGLLQSEEYGRCCFYGPDTKTFLDNNFGCSDWFGLYELYEKWVIAHCSKNGVKTGLDNLKAMNDHPNTERARVENAKTMNDHPNTKESRGENGRKTGGENMKTCLKHENTRKSQKENMNKNSSNNGRRTSSQKWQDLVTGYVSNPSGLTSYQKARGIDTALRKRLD